MAEERKLHISGGASGNVINLGDGNSIEAQVGVHCGSSAESALILTEIAAIRNLLEKVETRHKKKIENALDEAECEVEGGQPDKEEIGEALERALRTAKRTADFAEVSMQLIPHVRSLAVWLGEKWVSTFSSLGLL